MRRRYLWLLAVFVPTVLGLAALSYLIFAPDSQSEASPATPIVRQAPRVEGAISDESVIAPLDNDALAPSAPVEDEPVELPGTKPESPDRPAQLEPSDIIEPPMLASSTGTDSSTDAPAPMWSRRSLRLASLSAAGGGGGGAPGTNGSSKISGDSASIPVEVSNSGNDDSATAGGSSAAPNIPNPDDDDENDEHGGGDEHGGSSEEAEEDPPVSGTDPYPTNPFPHAGEHEPVQVPEPASFGLLVLGLAGCALGRRRKN